MKNHKKGFTLIELIVVIAILAILAIILVPSLIGYKKESERGIAVANARTCYITSIYAQGIDSENWQSLLPELLEPSFACEFDTDSITGEVKSAKWIYEDGTGALYFRDGSHSFVE